MIIGKTHRLNPTVDVPPWDQLDDPTANIASLFTKGDSVNLTALQRYLPSNVNNFAGGESEILFGEELGFPADAFSCDHFRMFEFKVRRCSRGRSHDWTECPYAHPGEKARRRDPRKFHYSGTACPEFRKGVCVKGDSCEFAHGVFECWLHPARYRTQPCKDGTHCRRRVCFFAHAPDQLRILPHGRQSLNGSAPDLHDGSPGRLVLESFNSKLSSPTSTLYSPPVTPPSESPPMSPMSAYPSASELAASMRNLQIAKARMSMSPPSWGVQMGPGLGSPRSPSALRPAFMSLPSTPKRVPTRSGLRVFEEWDVSCEEEPVMERVESGRNIRAKIYENVVKDNRIGETGGSDPDPDVDVEWVSELVK